jgi:hypothetical protein
MERMAGIPEGAVTILSPSDKFLDFGVNFCSDADGCASLARRFLLIQCSENPAPSPRGAGGIRS